MSVTLSEALLIPPCGGKLIDLCVPDEEQEELRARAADLPRIQLTARNVCDIEMLAIGAFSPLDRFMGSADYHRVLEEMRLASGALFSVPITLAVNRDAGISLDAEVTLADSYNNLLAVMRVEEVYAWDRRREAQLAYGTTDSRHPIVAEMNSWGDLYMSGTVRVLALPKHYDFRSLRLSPLRPRPKRKRPRKRPLESLSPWRN